MSITYIGVRTELPSRVVKKNPKDILNEYNAQETSKMLDLYIEGKITVEKTKVMIIARGADDIKKGGMLNFALMIPAESKEAADRVVQIVNVLGNNRLIRERIKTFSDGKSALNNLPELKELNNAITNLEKYIKGFVTAGWYYAPEVIYDYQG